MIAPPQLTAGWSGYICARTAECSRRSNQQRSFDLQTLPIAGLNQRRDAPFVIPITGNAMPGPDGVATEALESRPIQQHLQLPSMHRVLGPPIPRGDATQLGIDVVAVQPHQGPLLGLHANPSQQLLPDAEVVELAHRVGLKVDPDAEGLQFADGLEHHTRDADLVKRQRNADSADPATRDQHRWFVLQQRFILTCSVDRPS